SVPRSRSSSACLCSESRANEGTGVTRLRGCLCVVGSAPHGLGFPKHVLPSRCPKAVLRHNHFQKRLHFLPTNRGTCLKARGGGSLQEREAWEGSEEGKARRQALPAGLDVQDPPERHAAGTGEGAGPGRAEACSGAVRGTGCPQAAPPRALRPSRREGRCGRRRTSARRNSGAGEWGGSRLRFQSGRRGHCAVGHLRADAVTRARAMWAARLLCPVRGAAAGSALSSPPSRALQSWGSHWQTSVLAFKASVPMRAEPQRKKKRVDPKREQMVRERLKKRIRKLEKAALQLIPIEDFITPSKYLDSIRVRSADPLSVEESERRALLMKKWALYKQNQHKADMQTVTMLVAAQEKALRELRLESEELYQAAIRKDMGLFPFEKEGPSYTPPAPGYEAPEGKYNDVTKTYTY
uniref:Large ribosomal subunit protein mL40 n=2 Tax=Crocodylus porosus TaxID=8502 RepID=A0A7M4DW89_CROPO